jgi:hypothetical protein
MSNDTGWGYPQLPVMWAKQTGCAQTLATIVPAVQRRCTCGAQAWQNPHAGVGHVYIAAIRCHPGGWWCGAEQSPHRDLRGEDSCGDRDKVIPGNKGPSMRPRRLT